MLTGKQTDYCSDEVYKQLGKICAAALLVGLVFVLFASYRKRDRYEDYQERLRSAYEGLSPEEY
jgi:predicted histidine transporter YuiF (NhaC family)